MALTNAEKQKRYRERKKEKDAEAFLKKDRDRKKKAYVPTSQLSKSDREWRRLCQKQNSLKYYHKKKKEKEEHLKASNPITRTDKAKLVVKLAYKEPARKNSAKGVYKKVNVVNIYIYIKDT